MDFAIPADHRMKIKENEKERQVLGTCQRSKKWWNISVIVIPTVISMLERVHKGLECGLKSQKLEDV